MTDTPRFRLSARHEDGQEVVRLEGHLDLASIGIVEDALARSAAPTVVLDLGGLTFVDAVGLATIVRAKKQIEQRGGRLLVRNVHGLVDRVLTLAELRAYLLGDPPEVR